MALGQTTHNPEWKIAILGGETNHTAQLHQLAATVGVSIASEVLVESDIEYGVHLGLFGLSFTNQGSTLIQREPLYLLDAFE